MKEKNERKGGKEGKRRKEKKRKRVQKDKQRKQRHSLNLGKKRRESSKRNYYIISPRVIIKAIIITYVKAHSHTHPLPPLHPLPRTSSYVGCS